MKYKGMWLDGNPNQQPANTTRKNKNFVVSEKLGSWTNEKGFLKIKDFTYSPIGVIPLNRNDFVVYSTNNTNSEIGIIDSNNYYTVIINNTTLGFKTENPIHGTFYINNKNERIVAFTDGVTTPKILNVDKKYLSISNGQIDLFNISSSPRVDTDLEESGNLLTGTYYPILQYVRDDNSVSNWFKSYNPVYITDSRYSTNYNNYSGASEKLVSNKSIRYNINNINQNYKYIRIGYIYQSNGVKIAYKSKDIIITSNSISTIITGQENSEVIELDEVVIDKAHYKTIKHITNFKDTLYGIDTSVYQEPVQQSLVNNLTFNWYSELINPLSQEQSVITNTDKQSFKYHQFNNKKRSFCHDEVYALYIRFKYSWGYGKWYLCIGRQATDTEKNDSTEIKDIVDGVNKFYKNYQVKDTCTLTGEYLSSKEGSFSYWENENEVYPTGDYPTGNVRHFKFPSINWMRKNVWKNNNYGSNRLDVLSIKVLNLDLSLFKDKDGKAAVGFELGYAQRDNNNNRVIGQSLGIKAFFKQLATYRSELISLGGNWNTNSAYFDEEGVSSFDRFLRLYPYELLYNKNNIKPNKFRAEIRMTANSGFVNKRKINSSQYLLENDNTVDSYSKAIGIDYTISNTSEEEPDTLYEILSQEFVPANTIYDNKNNIFTEECYLVKYGKIGSLIDNLSNYQTIINSVAEDTNAVIQEENILITLLNINTDYYSDFRKQSIINTGHQHNPGLVNIIYGGDSYICDYSFNTYGINVNNNYEYKYSLDIIDNSSDKFDDKWNGIRAYHRFICESRYNINLRYVNPKNIKYTTYYPNINQTDKVLFLHSMERDNDPNNFVQGYSKDYHAQNNLDLGVIYNWQEEYPTDYPFRVIRSAPADKEFDINNWRDWRQNDYFEVTKSRGAAKNILGTKDFIYIHFEKELFKTVGREKFDFNGKNVYLGVGDIFDFPPEALVHDTHGYLGTQHKWSCLYTIYGYLFFDAEKGIWWLVDNSPKPISSNGLMTVFRDTEYPILDNPYTSFGIISSFDEELKRLLITYKNKVLKSEYRNKFKGVWRNEENFLNSLQPDDIVIKDNKYVIVQ